MLFGDLASKEPKDSNHARQQCTGRLGSCSAVKKPQHFPGEWLFGVFSLKRCCRRRVCAAKRSAQHVPPVAARGTATASSHARAGIVEVRGRPDPSPRRRAPSTSWERKKSAFFCFGTPVAGCIQGYSHSGELAWHVLAHDMNLMAKRAVEGE